MLFFYAIFCCDLFECVLLWDTATHAILVRQQKLYCNRCDEAIAASTTTDPMHQKAKCGPIGRKCTARMNLLFFDLLNAKDKVVSKKVVIADSYPTYPKGHTHEMGLSNRLSAKMSPIIVLKAEEMMKTTVIKLNVFLRFMGDYIGKNRRKRGLSRLQEDVKEKYGFIADLEDPAFNPPRESLINLWRRIKEQIMGTGHDQANTKQIIDEYLADPVLKAKCHMLEVQYGVDADPETNTEESPFLFVFQTKHQKFLLDSFGDVVQIDATHSTNVYDYYTFFIVVKDNLNKARTGVTFILKHEREGDIAKALTLIKEQNPEWTKKVSVCFTDKCLQQIAAVESVFDGITVLLCWVHMKRNLMRELPKHHKDRKASAKAIQYLDELRFAQVLLLCEMLKSI